jgi:uncharacterized membrane protein YqjE
VSGLFDSARRLLDTAVGIVQVRLELFGTELEQEKLRLADAAWQGALGLLLLGLALVGFFGFVVMLFWEGYRLPAVGVLTLAFAAAGIGLLRRARATLRPREGGIFALSLGELRHDREGLAVPPATGGSAAAGTAAPADRPPPR